MITIGFLADYLDTIPTLARWFRDQWPDYFANRSQLQMEQDFLSGAARDRLPIRLVAFESGELAGTKTNWEMLMLLSERGVSLDYMATDAKKDLQTLKEALGR